MVAFEGRAAGSKGVSNQPQSFRPSRALISIGAVKRLWQHARSRQAVNNSLELNKVFFNDFE